MNDVVEKIPNIYEFILTEENEFRTARVPLASNWRDWNFWEHVDRSFQLKNSRFYKGQQDYTRPFSNIILPIAQVNYRTEGFDVKDVQIYVDDTENYHKSLLARKMHTWWSKEHAVDTAIDESVESYFDYGLALLKNVNEAKPEVVPLQQIAFCDQTDIMSGPICIKHHYSISELLDFKDKWNSTEVDKAILMSRTSQEVDQANEDQVKTPGKYVEVYELHGMFPESWLGPEKLGENWEDTGKYSPQIHIVTYYVSPQDGKSKQGITLFKGKETKPIFKALVRDPIHGRACGRGGIEELFHPQIWTNFSELHIHQMLEAVSKVILTTNKTNVARLNNLSNIKQGQVLDLDEDGKLEQLNLQPINKAHFDVAVNKWEQNARVTGSASNPALGQDPTSGTPLGTTEIVASQGQGIHEYRQGKIAVFWAEVYRDWVLPHFSKEIVKGSKWLEELTLDELEEVANKVSVKKANDKVKQAFFKGAEITENEALALREGIRAEFLQGGNKRPLEIIKDEYRNLALDVEISIANKQKNLPEMVAKLNSVFRSLFTPGAIQAVRQDPELAGLLNEILESSGMKQRNFTSQQAQQAPQQQPQQAQPQQQLATNNT